MDLYEQYLIDRMAETERELMKKGQKDIGDVRFSDVKASSEKLNQTLEALAKS